MSALDLDFDALGQYADENLPGLLFVTVSGAHLYGFPSADSDVDLRGSFAAPLADVLGLDTPRETREPSGMVGGVEVEMVGHEIAKYLRLLVKPNGYVLEQILSPLVVRTSPAHEELITLARAGLSKSYTITMLGLRGGEWREYQRPNVGKTVKRLLYLHRVLMTGIVLMEEGVVEANLHALNERFRFNLGPLLAMKTREQADVAGDDAAYRQTLEELFLRLDAARDKSALPEDVPNRAAISEFLVRMRLANVSLQK